MKTIKSQITDLIKNSRLVDYLILLLILLIAMWQIVLGFAAMKWDIMDIYLPWKYFVGESISNGTLPLWNPFMRSGFPQMGDPNTWYPVSWIIALLKKYDVHAVHFEYLLHLYIAGIGMYKVAKQYSMSRVTCIMIASAYMLCGFFIGNAQHFGWLISAAWFPFIYFYFTQLRAKPGLVGAIKLSLCFFMMLSGGYPGIFIVSLYLFVAFFIYYLLHFFITKDYIRLKQWLLFLSVSAVVFFLLSAVVIVCSLDLTAHITRGAGLPVDKSNWGILTGSLTPKALTTFLFPYAGSINDQVYWGTDFSMINCYMGILPLLLLIFINFQKKVAINIRVFSLIGVLCILTAFAEIIPIRKWLYMFLPFMDLFRFSALFRLFAIFFFLLVAGYAMERVLTNKQISKKFFRYLLIVLVLFGLLEFFMLFRIEKWQFKQLLFEGPIAFDKIAGIKEKIFLQCLLQFGIVTIIAALFKYRPKNFSRYLISICCFDMIMATQMNINATVVQAYPVEKVNNAFSDFPDGYPIPSLTLPMSETKDGVMRSAIPYLWINLTPFYKIPSCDGFSPYLLYNTGKALGNKHYQAINKYPLLFLASSIDKEAIVDTNSIDSKSFHEMRILAFNPNLIKVGIITDKPQNLVLLQNYYPYWEATVNGKEQPVTKTNDTFMSVRIDKGASIVTFEFKPKKVIYAFYLSLGSLILCIVLILIPVLRQLLKQKKYFRLALTGLFTFALAILCASNLYGRHSSGEIYELLNKKIQEQVKNKAVIKNIYNNDDHYGLDYTAIQIDTKHDLGKLVSLLENSKEDTLFYAQINKIKFPEIKEIIIDYYPTIISEDDLGSSFFLYATKRIKGNNGYSLVSYNNFETDCTGWTRKVEEVDSTDFHSGKKCARLDSTNNFSSVFSKKRSDITKSKRCILRVSLYAKFDQITEPMIVFSVRRGDKNILWQGENMNNYCEHPQQWSKAYLITEIDSEIRPDDFVEIYVWNNSKRIMRIDDVKIELRDINAKSNF